LKSPDNQARSGFRICTTENSGVGRKKTKITFPVILPTVRSISILLKQWVWLPENYSFQIAKEGGETKL